MKPEYFESAPDREVCKAILSYVEKYSALPSEQELLIDLSKNQTLSDAEVDKAGDVVSALVADASKVTADWLIEKTEEWCKNQAVYNALGESIVIVEDNKLGKKKKASLESIPDLLQKALDVSLTPARPDVWDISSPAFKEYFRRSFDPATIACKFDLQFLTEMTGGGLRNQDLMLIVAPFENGKSHLLHHITSAQIRDGKKVFLVHCEMTSPQVVARIAANYSYAETHRFTKKDCQSQESYTNLNADLLRICEATDTSVSYIVQQLERLRRAGWVPDLVVIDYLEKMSTGKRRENTNEEYGEIITDIQQRICRKYNIPVIIPQQVNRAGMKNRHEGVEIDIDHIAKSSDSLKHADYIVAMTYFPKNTKVKTKSGKESTVVPFDTVYFQNWKTRDVDGKLSTAHRKVRVNYDYSRFIDIGTADDTKESENDAKQDYKQVASTWRPGKATRKLNMKE